MSFKTIYPQSITGKYRSIKDYSGAGLLLIYFLSSWIRWDRGQGMPNQAILVDLPNRKAYLFGIEIWPEEVYYITAILICAALGLFFVTALYGRIWCGYTCPHTVFVDIFNKIENYFQGDRNARIKLDSEPMTREKFIKKLKTHISWIFVGFGFAFGWVCYFYDAPTLLKDVFKFKVSTDGMIWLVGLTLSTYFFAGWIRERVCIYMCPYGRFQSAMIDNDTSVVTYHEWRGEPRGKESKSGDCIDCNKCVVVCPMGIDIRDGLQLPCIGCGLCIDACNSVMEKIGKPLDLIGYDSVNSSKAKQQRVWVKKKFFQFRTIMFGVIFLLVIGATVFSLLNKAPMKITILHDRDVLFTTLPDGSVRNKYVLKVFNKQSKPKKLLLLVSGLDDSSIKTLDMEEYKNKFEFDLPSESQKEIIVFVKVPEWKKEETDQKIIFSVEDLETDYTIRHKTMFIGKR